MRHQNPSLCVKYGVILRTRHAVSVYKNIHKQVSAPAPAPAQIHDVQQQNIQEVPQHQHMAVYQFDLYPTNCYMGFLRTRTSESGVRWARAMVGRTSGTNIFGASCACKGCVHARMHQYVPQVIPRTHAYVCARGLCVSVCLRAITSESWYCGEEKACPWRRWCICLYWTPYGGV